jgi:hypothetical protein
MGESSMIIPAAIHCHAGAAKRALMTGKNVNTLGADSNSPQYPVQYIVLRGEPENAVEIMRALGWKSSIRNLSRTGQVDRW